MINVTYAYESVSYWNKEKKQPRCHRRLIGIFNPETGEIKSTTKKKRIAKEIIVKADSGDMSIDRHWLCAKRTFYGATYLFDCIGKETGVTNDLKACFSETYKEILSIAYYLIKLAIGYKPRTSVR